MQQSEANFSQDRLLSKAKVNSTLMKVSVNWGLSLGKKGAKGYFHVQCLEVERIFS